MLSVVFTILKFIGITILVLLGILIVLLCLVLFVPIRYKADGFYKDTYCVRAKVSWLLHVVSFAILYEKDQPFHMMLRIFGIPVYDNRKKKEKKKSKTKAPKPTPEIVASSISEKEEGQTIVREEKPVNPASMEENPTKVEEIETKNTETKEKAGVIQRIKLLISKITGFFRNIKYTFQRMCDTIKGIKANITYYVELFKKDSTKAAILACKKQLLRIFKNLKPQKFQLNLHLGMEDPATMGEILGVWGMLYPIHQGHIDICPDFEQAIFEGEFYCKGRVTVYIYIWTVMMILFDKDIGRLRRCLVREGK